MGSAHSKELEAVGLLIISAILWSLGGVLIKLVEWNPLAIAGTRSGIAAVTIIIYLRRPKFRWSLMEIAGGIAYAGTVILFVVANRLTTAANTILLQYTAPIYVALFGAWFLGERATLKDWISIVFVLGGISLFFMDQLSTEGTWGNIYAIISGMCFAWLVLFLRKQKSESPLQSILLGNIITAVICSPFMFRSIPTAPSSWIALVLLGVLQLGVSYIFYSIAIKRVKALEAVLIPMIEPILNPLWAFLVIGETLGQWAFVGGMIVLVTVSVRGVLATRNRKVSSTNTPIQ